MDFAKIQQYGLGSAYRDWLLQAKAAEDPRHRFFVRSLDLVCQENTDIDSCGECSCVLICSGGCHDLLSFSPHTVWGCLPV